MNVHAIAVLTLALTLLSACSSPKGAPVRVEFKDFAFSPNVIVVPARTRLVLQLTNSGTVEHDINGREVALHGHVAAGKRLEQEVGGLEPGRYEIWCSVSGHRELGMVGTLEVR